MLRGGKSASDTDLRRKLAEVIEAQGVLPRLAKRVAFQLVLKFDIAELADESVWRAVGQRLRRETEQLQSGIGLVDRQIIVALPKLSADQIEEFLRELQAANPAIARTILN